MCTPQDFQNMFGHFTILCMKGLSKNNVNNDPFKAFL